MIATKFSGVKLSEQNDELKNVYHPKYIHPVLMSSHHKWKIMSSFLSGQRLGKQETGKKVSPKKNIWRNIRTLIRVAGGNRP